MPITRRQLFTEAWNLARAIAASYRTLRAAFAAALRKVWALVKAMVEVERWAKPAPVKPAAPSWAEADPYRARAVAHRRARLGNIYSHAW